MKKECEYCGKAFKAIKGRGHKFCCYNCCSKYHYHKKKYLKKLAEDHESGNFYK